MSCQVSSNARPSQASISRLLVTSSYESSGRNSSLISRSRSFGSGTVPSRCSMRPRRLLSTRASRTARMRPRATLSNVPQPMTTSGPAQSGCAAAYASASMAPQECPTSAGRVPAPCDCTRSCKSAMCRATLSGSPPLPRWNGSRMRNESASPRATGAMYPGPPGPPCRTITRGPAVPYVRTRIFSIGIFAPVRALHASARPSTHCRACSLAQVYGSDLWFELRMQERCCYLQNTPLR